MSEQNPEIVEFFASTRSDNPLTFLLRVDKDEAERWGTAGWYPINRGIAGFGKRLDNGETVMLHRLIMGAQPGDVVKFRDDDNTNITKNNMYVVGKKDKGAMVASRQRPGGGRSDDYDSSDETGDDMSNTQMIDASPFGRKTGDRARKTAQPQPPVAASAQSGDWLPIANQFVLASNVITIIDHLNDDEPQNNMEVVTSFQEYNEREKRMRWYVVDVDGNDADNLRTYLQAHINPNALEASTALVEYKQRVQELERENAQQVRQIEKLNTENAEFKKRIKDVEKIERRFKNIAVSLLDDAA